MIQVGQTVGNYRITAKVGEGGMGVVFLAEHPVIARRAALKAIHPDFEPSAEVVARFVNEARLISQIGHEHIVDVTDFGRTPEGDFYFIMEYLAGEALADTIQRDGAMPLERALSIAAQIADALGASHARGVVHRDLKPENVFLIPRSGTRDFVKVLDFGLAKLMSGDAKTQAGPASPIMGTPYYMSPEQCEGLSGIDGRADVYALGCILFEMLTGSVPFGGESSGEILAKQLTTRAPAARRFVAGLPEAVDVILQRALAKDPADRYQSMTELRLALLAPGIVAPPAVGEDISAGIRGAQLTASEAPAPRTRARTTFREAAGAFASTPGVPVARPRGRGRAWIGGLAAAAALVALFAGRGAPAPTAARAAAAPATIRLTFGSDPAGAEIVGRDGRSVGVTPLSIELAPSDAAARYVLRKAGFLPKSVSLIPNVSSPVFVTLEAEPAVDPPAPRSAAPARARLARPAPRRAAAPTLPAPPYEDDVLSPSFR
jgi:serine/threonine-protein kinase